MGSIGLAIGNEKTDTVDIAMPTSTSLSASPGVVYPRCLRSNGCISVEKKAGLLGGKYFDIQC